MKIFLDTNICLDLLDTKRPTSDASIAWYMHQKDDSTLSFCFSSDAITTLYYVLTQKRKLKGIDVVRAIDALSSEIPPCYLIHNDYINAKNSFYDDVLDDFEDLMVLHSAVRFGCDLFLTNDKTLLKLGRFGTMKIAGPA